MAAYGEVQALLGRGVSRPTLYRVEFTPPGDGTFLDSVSELNDYSRYLIKEATVPGSTVITTAVKGQSRIGVFYDQPIGVDFQDTFQLQFVERNDFFVHKFFMDWNKLTVPGFEQSREGAMNIHVGYYDEFATTIQLIKMDSGRTGLYDKMTYTIHGAYPVDVNTIVLASDAVDSYVVTTILFKYETYHIKYGGSRIPSESNSSGNISHLTFRDEYDTFGEYNQLYRDSLSEVTRNFPGIF